jgi:hypothetical protein
MLSKKQTKIINWTIFILLAVAPAINVLIGYYFWHWNIFISTALASKGPITIISWISCGLINFFPGLYMQSIFVFSCGPVGWQGFILAYVIYLIILSLIAGIFIFYNHSKSK